MLQVLVTGLIALGTKWLLDGGIRRRDRHVIREELELADLLGDRPEAAQLRASAERRLQRYLRPSLTRRAAPTLRSIGVFTVAFGIAVTAVILVTDSTSTTGEKVTTGLVFGAMAAALTQLLQALLEAWMRHRTTRAEIEARRRAHEQTA